MKLKILHNEIAKIYIGLKQKTRDSQELSQQHSVCTDKSGALSTKIKRLNSQNEREIIMQLDFFLLIEYIKSAIDIILQLKFDEIEQKINCASDSQVQSLEKALKSKMEHHSIISDQVFSPRPDARLKQSTTDKNHCEISKASSSISQTQHQPCPPVYEAIICELEAEVRKHIRI